MTKPKEKTKPKHGTWWLLHPDNRIHKFKRPVLLPSDPFVLAKLSKENK